MTRNVMLLVNNWIALLTNGQKIYQTTFNHVITLNFKLKMSLTLFVTFRTKKNWSS